MSSSTQIKELPLSWQLALASRPGELMDDMQELVPELKKHLAREPAGAELNLLTHRQILWGDCSDPADQDRIPRRLVSAVPGV
jgi:hypothetical protein